MFHAIVVDDESAALNRFERIAAGDGRISLEGKFQYAEDAIEFVRQQKVDIAFLDIEMPEMSGLELAEQLMEIDPYISVIFVTAYDKYALEAFRAHAIGYLLKPLDNNELTEQLDSLYRRLGQRTAKNANQRLTIRCFGEFSVKAAADEEPAIRWKTAKAEELFALLVNYQGRAKSKESLIDALWPELEPEKSINLFRVTCTYIRTALSERGFSDVLIRDWNGYKLNTERINCDLFRFRQAVRDVPSPGLETLEAASALYSGEYLDGKLYEWAGRARDQLESDFKKIQFRLSEALCIRGDFGKACEALDKVLEFDACEEEAVSRLIQMKLEHGDTAAAIKVYRTYEQRLKNELGLSPSEKIYAMFRGGLS